MKQAKWNDDWLFWEDVDAFSLVWNLPGQAEKISLPHDAMLHKDACAESKNAANTGYRDGGSYVYYKALYAPASWAYKTITLKFEGVYQNAAVYVNSQLAAQCAYGYSTFYVPLNDFLRYGEENAIRVLVRTGDMPNSRWYSGSGIYRDVYLLEGNLIHVAETGVRISTRECADDALLAAATPIQNRSHRAVPCEVLTEILDADGNVAASEKTPVFLKGGSSENIDQRILVSDPKIRRISTPFGPRWWFRGPWWTKPRILSASARLLWTQSTACGLMAWKSSSGVPAFTMTTAFWVRPPMKRRSTGGSSC